MPEVTEGLILGHEGIGVIDEVGPSVTNFKKGDRVLISCISSCGKSLVHAKFINIHNVNGR